MPEPLQAAVHGPYEDLIIEAIKLFRELIQGMTPDQRIKAWDNWMNFWQPMWDAISPPKPK